MGSFPGNKTNYTVIGNKPKEKRELDTSRMKEVKEAIVQILKDDYDFWDSKDQKQPGIERLILLRKVCTVEPKTNMQVFNYLLEELEIEQKIIPVQDESLTRYIYLNLGSK